MRLNDSRQHIDKVRTEHCNSAKGSLTIVGAGINLARHITPESRIEIVKAQKVFYLVPDPIGKEVLMKLNSTAESLYPLYKPELQRLIIYNNIVERILMPVRLGLVVCAAFYGHPGLFVYYANEAIRRARAEGFEVRCCQEYPHRIVSSRISQ